MKVELLLFLLHCVSCVDEWWIPCERVASSFYSSPRMVCWGILGKPCRNRPQGHWMHHPTEGGPKRRHRNRPLCMLDNFFNDAYIWWWHNCTMLILIQLGLSSLLNTRCTFYNNNGRDYKAVPYGGLHIQSNTPPASQWGNSVQNQQKTFFFD